MVVPLGPGTKPVYMARHVFAYHTGLSRTGLRLLTTGNTDLDPVCGIHNKLDLTPWRGDGSPGANERFISTPN